MTRPRPLVVGEALQVGEDVLDLHQALFEGGHGKHGELVARVDGKDGQEPPAASGTVGRRLEEQEQRRGALVESVVHMKSNHLFCFRRVSLSAGDN